MVDPDEGVDTAIIISGFYEEEVYRAVEEYLEADDVFWDVGANLGLHAFTVKKNFPRVEVFAFEPNPSMLALLQAAANKNRLGIHVIPVALDVKNRDAQLFIHPGNTGRCGLHNWNADPDLPSITVKTASGDYLVEQGLAKPPNVIKIDVEGHEKPALEGLRRVLESGSLRAIVFEDRVDDSSGVKDLLSQHGYAILPPLTRLDSKNPSLNNYVAVRAAR